MTLTPTTILIYSFGVLSAGLITRFTHKLDAYSTGAFISVFVIMLALYPMLATSDGSYKDVMSWVLMALVGSGVAAYLDHRLRI